MARINKVEGTCIPVEYISLGMLGNNVYIISDGQTTIVVDPSCKVDEIMAALDGRRVDAIVLTHCHFDHIGAARDLRDSTGAIVIASDIDARIITGEEKPVIKGRQVTPCPVDYRLHHKDVVQIGAMPWKVISTPGHTKGSICLFIDPQFGMDPDKAPLLISGDTLFCGGIGRVDFEGGSMQDMRKSLKRLAALPDETVVLPGHGELTTIKNERRRTFAAYAL